MTELGAVCTCGHQWIMHASNDQCTRTTCACCQFKELPMTEQLPRTIAAEDIRVGDRVRATGDFHGDVRSYEFTVATTNGRDIVSAKNYYHGFEQYTFTLLSRPEPLREIGSRWEDRATHARYILDEDGDYLRYKAGSTFDGSHVFRTNWLADTASVNGLIPLDPS